MPNFAAAAGTTEANIEAQTKATGESAIKSVTAKSKVASIFKEFNQKRQKGLSTLEGWKAGLGLVGLGLGMAFLGPLGPLAVGAAGGFGTFLGGKVGKHQLKQEMKSVTGQGYMTKSADQFLQKTDDRLWMDVAKSTATGYLGGTGIDKAKAGAEFTTKAGATFGQGVAPTGWAGIKAGVGGITGGKLGGTYSLAEIIWGDKMDEGEVIEDDLDDTYTV